MKKLIILILALNTHFVFAQDVITKKDGTDIESKVLEVLPTEVKFKKFNNMDGPVFTLSKGEILMIRYQNGTKDIFNDTEVLSSPMSSPIFTDNREVLSSEDLYMMGTSDAATFYKGRNSGAGGTLAASLLSPILGLIPAIACSASTPKDENLMFPKQELVREPAYHRGYVTKAKKVKKRKIWTNWGIGLGANIIAVLILQNRDQ